MGTLTLLASGIGIVGATVLLGQMVLGNRFITSAFSRDIIRVNRLHQLLGKTGVLLVLAHPVVMSFTLMKPLFYIFIPDSWSIFSLYVSMGRAAFIILISILVSSVLFRASLKYRTWHHIHVLTYPMMALILWHGISIGTRLSTTPLLNTYWYVLMSVFALLALIRIMTWAGIGKTKYKLISKKRLTDHVTEYRVSPYGSPITPAQGQFVYLQTKRFGEAHPFTALDHDEKLGELTFAIKSSGPFSGALTHLPIGSQVFIDGPYGVFTRESNGKSPNIFIAGGIGITPFVRPIDARGKPTNYLIYSNRYPNRAIYRNRLKRRLGPRYINVDSRVRRIDATMIKKSLPKHIWEHARFFICGPASFNESVSQGLTKLGVDENRIFSEKFSL